MRSSTVASHSGSARASQLASICLLVLLARPLAAHADDDVAPYRPIPVETGAAVEPPPDLLETAARLQEAVAAQDADAVAALLAERLTFVVSGITVDTRRDVEHRPAWKTVEEALDSIGSLYEAGELPARGAPVQHRPSAAEAAFIVIETPPDRVDWGRDPLVPGAICTYRGARWNHRAAEKSGAGGGGYWVSEPTEVRAAASDDAKIVARLVPGRLYFSGYLDEPKDDWSGVRLPAGGVGAVPDAKLHPTRVGGHCFTAKKGGGWAVSAFATSQL